MISRFKKIFGKQEAVIPQATYVAVKKPSGIFSTDDYCTARRRENTAAIWEKTFNESLKPVHSTNPSFAMDSAVGFSCQYTNNLFIGETQLSWFANKSFIGFQMCALLSQQWLINNACWTPAKDAVRNGYDITVNDGTEVGAEVLDRIRKLDVKYKLNQNMIEFVAQGRVFGIRIAIFIVDSTDPLYYEKPFNIDGVTPNSYRGISQVDPYWMTPQLDQVGSADAMSMHFYEPTWWVVQGKKIHRSHMVIFRTEEVPDILKPSYLYAGISIPQKIYERVYAAERVANEAPLLALTKRTDVIKTDLAQAAMNEEKFNQRVEEWVVRRDNYGIKIIGLEDEVVQFDTSLADLDSAIMTQFQLVAAACKVPAVKLLGTSPKGFNSTGEHEEATYHEELESIQSHDLTPLLERHHQILMRSAIVPEFNIKPFDTTVSWNELDAMTTKEQAELNKLKADTDNLLSSTGAIDGEDIRNRIINDPESGYSGFVDEIPEQVESDPDGA